MAKKKSSPREERRARRNKQIDLALQIDGERGKRRLLSALRQQGCASGRMRRLFSR